MAWPDPTKLQPFVRIFPRDALGTYLLEFSTVDKLSHSVFCSRRLMHFQTVLNIYKFADSTTFRFVLLSVHQVKVDFILILALASNNQIFTTGSH